MNSDIEGRLKHQNSRELIKKFRASCERNIDYYAYELAKFGDDASVKELIRIVKGGHKGSWLCAMFFELEDQITGIRALGESKNPLALEYLRKLTTHYEKDSQEIYSNARGDLKRKLKRDLGHWSRTPPSLSPGIGVFYDETYPEPYNDAHYAIWGAITKLKSDL